MQSEGSCVVADDMGCPKVYTGNDAYAITCLNATSGKVLSGYSTKAEVWSTPAIYDGKLYCGSNDRNLYCFTSAPTICTAISASLSKTQVNLNQSESVTVSGKLYSPLTTYGQLFTPGLRNQPVKVSFETPSGTLVDVSATTDEKGEFTATYTPTVAGDWKVSSWYNGTELYSYAYSDEAPLKVVASPSTPPPSEAEIGIPVEYIYAGVAIVVIVIIVAAAYFLMKRKK
jgi:outer membrane protein assembly factor BamB